MNDPKAILQEYLISTKAPKEVLNAMRQIDENKKNKSADLKAARDAIFWLLDYIEFTTSLYQVDIARTLMSDEHTDDDAKREISKAMLEDAECDHSVGICYCELRGILEDDSNMVFLSQSNINRHIAKLRQWQESDESK